jgi:uncharacterized membrane-anchored protein YhcB (DUF1043 family)
MSVSLHSLWQQDFSAVVGTTIREAYSDGVSNGERLDPPGDNATPPSRHDPSGRLGGWLTETNSNLTLLTVALLALLVGLILGRVFSLRADEQLSAARAEIQARDERIRTLEGELARVDPNIRNIIEAQQSIADKQAELDARERRLDVQQMQITQRERELADHWYVPKPSGQQVQAFLKNISDSISRLLGGEDGTVPCRC